MALPNVIMQAPAGVDVPTQVHLPDGSTVKPAARRAPKPLQIVLDSCQNRAMPHDLQVRRVRNAAKFPPPPCSFRRGAFRLIML
jgi:hypothetical protein